MWDYNARTENMSHLPTERLAALVDEMPTAAELAHLSSCDGCARERAVFRTLAEMAVTESTRIGSPLTKWETLAPVLVSDGVIDTGRGSPVRRRSVRRPWVQAAAALLLLGGGVGAGRYSVHGGKTAANADSLPTFRSVDEARAAQAQSQFLYQSATAYLAQQDTGSLATDSPSAMRARLVALDRAREVMGEALNDAPYDPVINGYYLTTIGQREATLRQLNTVLPASMGIISY
jgi:hypothetical protein